MLHDNARPFTANRIKALSNSFRWDRLNHPSYSVFTRINVFEKKMPHNIVIIHGEYIFIIIFFVTYLETTDFMVWMM